MDDSDGARMRLRNAVRIVGTCHGRRWSSSQSKGLSLESSKTEMTSWPIGPSAHSAYFLFQATQDFRPMAVNSTSTYIPKGCPREFVLDLDRGSEVTSLRAEHFVAISKIPRGIQASTASAAT